MPLRDLDLSAEHGFAVGAEGRHDLLSHSALYSSADGAADEAHGSRDRGPGDVLAERVERAITVSSTRVAERPAAQAADASRPADAGGTADAADAAGTAGAARTAGTGRQAGLRLGGPARHRARLRLCRPPRGLGTGRLLPELAAGERGQLLNGMHCIRAPAPGARRRHLLVGHAAIVRERSLGRKYRTVRRRTPTRD